MTCIVFFVSNIIEIHEPNDRDLSLKNILPWLKEIRDIFPLGVRLGISLSTLRQIEKEYKDNLDRQKMEMADFWLCNSSDCSWGRLAEAVKDLGGHDQLASKLNELEKNRLPEAETNQSDAQSGRLTS